MKVLVTGSSGQLGLALAQSRLRPDDVHFADRSTLDIAAPAQIGTYIETVAPAAIVNCAAYTAVDRAESEVDAARAANADAVAVLAEQAERIGARLITVSTDFVFDGSASVPYAIDAATNPLSTYGRTKLQGEQAALAYPGNLVVRTAWVYAARGRNFVHTMLSLMASGDEVRVVADQVGTPTHAATLADAIWNFMALGTSGIRHVTDAGTASWYDFAVAIQEEALALGLLDRSVPIIPIATTDYPTPAVRPAYSVLDKARSWQDLGKVAPHWRAALREMLVELKGLTA